MSSMSTQGHAERSCWSAFNHQHFLCMTLESIPSDAPRSLRVARWTSRRSTRTASSCSAGRRVNNKDALDLSVLHPRRNVAICSGGPQTRLPLSNTTTSSSAILMSCDSKKTDPVLLLFSLTSSTPSTITCTTDAIGLQSRLTSTPAMSSRMLRQTPACSPV